MRIVNAKMIIALNHSYKSTSQLRGAISIKTFKPDGFTTTWFPLRGER